MELACLLGMVVGGQHPGGSVENGLQGVRRDAEVQERRKGMGFCRLHVIASKHALTPYRHP